MFPLQFQVGFYLAAERARFAQERQMEVGLATLVFKAFYALLEYAIGRKRKAVRIRKALEERRNRLLRTGVTRWMKVGFTTICLVWGFKSL